MITDLILATAATGTGAIGMWLLLHRRVEALQAYVAALLATNGEQQASLTAIPATEVEHRAAVAEDHRRRLAARVERIDAYYLDQRAIADVVPLPVAPTWRAAA